MKINFKKVQLLIAEKQMTYTELAKKTNLDIKNFSYYRKNNGCSHITIGKIAKALEVPVEEIILEY